MCDYSGPDDPVCFAKKEISGGALVATCKKFLAERIEDIKKVGLPPFCEANPALPVCFFHYYSSPVIILG